MNNTMIKVENVSKEYKLGQIGGATLKETIQSKIAKRRGLEDPNKKIGARDYEYGELFRALEGISFEVKKGDRIGIIGHNGAGKSTLLKLLCRVTAPTTGTIGLNGRITSMLEVGTGFHAELTGRENIYMNGAILGMTKKEIDGKMEEIIDFSEVRKFVDTPVKRYSSGMYVKLAFSVAAHLNSDIMIMDEVLAVGDMAFQTKCLNKMNELSMNEGKTILYVSHNMNTVRKLCNRVIVLNRGQIIYDGNVEQGISLYLKNGTDTGLNFDLNSSERPYSGIGVDLRATTFELLDLKQQFMYNESIHMRLTLNATRAYSAVRVRSEVYYFDGTEIGNYETESFSIDKVGEFALTMNITPTILPIGKYYMVFNIFEVDSQNNQRTLDQPSQRVGFEIYDDNPNGVRWEHEYMGHVRMGKLELENI